MRMQTRGRGLKFASMTAVVVLALTGFSTGRGHGGTSSSGGSSDGGGGGGGCSSSSQDHDSSSSSSSSGGSSSGVGKSYDNDDDYDDSSGGTGGTSGTGSSKRQLKPATVRLVKCATVKEPYATVEVTNPNPRDATFWVDVSFKGKGGATLKDETWKVDVLADDKVTVDIELASKSLASSVDRCVAEPEAEPFR